MASKKAVEKPKSSAKVASGKKSEPALAKPEPVAAPVLKEKAENLHKATPSEKKRRVLLDAGHGGQDPGSIGLKGLRECDLALSIARETMALLEERGVDCSLTRTEDETVTMAKRIEKSYDFDCLVSVHLNAFEDPKANGLEVIYPAPGGPSKALANYLQQALVKHVGGRDRGIKQSPGPEIPRNLYVLQTAACPVAIAECGFITNDEDVRRLGDGGHAAARALADGVASFLASLR